MKIFKEIFRFALNNRSSGLIKINNKDDFNKRFEGNSIKIDTKKYKAYEKAWDSRKFEIDNYWKRTTYFWAFQVTSFTAYIAILNSTNYNKEPRENTFTLFFAISIGFITSISWVLINIGSKFWQRHWEKQIDMLEDEITGALYKTIYAYKNQKTFSVSKINDIVSRFFCFIWVILWIQYVVDNLTLNGTFKDIAYVEVLITLGTIYFVLAMFKGYGRGSFSSTEFEYYNRDVFK
ncbi:hypothetical protein [Pedobacter sp.]|uniref:RipA family octameric membrane protein n=1 Tax=Pedobacter sp. TaxID=1411316 RepID=UPI003BA8B938